MSESELLVLVRLYYDVYRRCLNILPGISRQNGGDDLGEMGQFLESLAYDRDGTGSWKELEAGGDAKLLAVAKCLLADVQLAQHKRCWASHLPKGFVHKLDDQIRVIECALPKAVAR